MQRICCYAGIYFANVWQRGVCIAYFVTGLFNYAETVHGPAFQEKKIITGDDLRLIILIKKLSLAKLSRKILHDARMQISKI